jgi:hypothetical protein
LFTGKIVKNGYSFIVQPEIYQRRSVMRKIIVIILLSATAVFTLLQESKAVDYMIGLRSGYYSWEPYLKEVDGSGMSDMDWGTGILYGPVLSVMFTGDLSFSLASLVGKQSTHWQSTFSEFDSTTEVTGNYYFEAFRADFDSALSYRLGDNFKIFAGYKYQYMELKYSYTEIRTDPSNVVTEINVVPGESQKSPFHGPAAGIGVSQPLTEHYFLTASLSALYMLGTVEFDGNRYSASSPGFVLQDHSGDNIKLKMRQIGMNFEPAIGMNPGDNLPIVTIGFRYQGSKIQFTGNSEDMTDKWLNDTILGVFVTIVYMF